MTLGEKQQKFTRMLADLIIWAYTNGYGLTLGEAFRSDEQAEINALGSMGRRDLCYQLERADGKWKVFIDKVLNNGKNNGVRNSLHEKRLALDLMLFKDGVYLMRTEDYRPLGEQWELMGGTWGGRFSDGNHFSLEHEGVK